MTNDIMNTINQRHHKKPLEKSRCEKSDKRGNVVNSKKFEWIYSGIAYVTVASATEMAELDWHHFEKVQQREMAHFAI